MVRLGYSRYGNSYLIVQLDSSDDSLVGVEERTNNLFFLDSELNIAD